MRRSFFLVPLFLLGCAASPGPRFTETARERAEWNLSLARAHYERTQALFDPFFLQGRTGRPASPEAETEMRKSLAALDEAIRLDPGLAEPYRLRARLRSFRSENLEAALADYGEVLRRLPKDVDAHYERGLLYLDQEKPNLATPNSTGRSSSIRSTSLRSDSAPAFVPTGATRKALSPTTRRRSGRAVGPT